MFQIEEKISNLISSQFPQFYRDEGPAFIAFVRAYYEWLEQNFQLLTLEDPTGFDVGATITQGNVTGKIISLVDGMHLVLVEGSDTFKCFNICSDLTPVVTTNGTTTYTTSILQGGTTRRMGTIFQARKLPEYSDIDTTLDLFVTKFKEKYLRNIEFDTKTNKRLLVKNAIDLYRSKGTQRSIDLFFRLVYALDVEVFYPGDVLFQPSEARWYVPKYIEITGDTVTRAVSLVGKQITGIRSGSTAFVQQYIKQRTSKGTYSHVLVISNITGSFELGESLIADELYLDSPRVVGSLASVNITSSLPGFAVGDILDIESVSGTGGKLRVAETKGASGTVDFQLVEGGFGFTTTVDSVDPSDTQVLVSNTILTVSDVIVGNTVSAAYVIQQGSGYSNTDYVKVESDFGENAALSIVTDPAGAIVELRVDYPGSGFVSPDPLIPETILSSSGVPSSGTGAVVDVVTDFPTKFFTLFEPIQQDASIGTVIEQRDRLALTFNSLTGSVSVGDVVAQIKSDGTFIGTGVVTTFSGGTTGGTLEITRTDGIFLPNRQTFVVKANLTNFLFVTSVSISVAVVTANTFIESPTSDVIAQHSGTRGKVTFVSRGTGAYFSVIDTNNQTQVTFNTDSLSNTTMLEAKLDGVTVPFLQDGTFGVNDILATGMNFVTKTLGSVRTIGLISPGSNYTVDPSVVLLTQGVAAFDKRDHIFRIANATGSFSVGETIVQGYDETVCVAALSDSDGFVPGDLIEIRSTSGQEATGVIKSNTPFTNTVTIKNVVGNLSNTAYEELRSLSNNAITASINSAFFREDPVVARAIVKSVQSDIVRAQRLELDDLFQANVQVQGSRTETIGILVDIAEDYETQPIGLNASVSSQASFADGVVVAGQVVDSALGFVDGQSITIFANNNFVGQGQGFVEPIGTGSGLYLSRKGFASDISKLHDGSYYQEYSYDMMSRLPVDRYKEMFDRAMHTAGTKMFGSVFLYGDADVDIGGNIASDLVSSNTNPLALVSVRMDSYPREPTFTLRNNLINVTDRRRVNIYMRV